MSRVLRDDQARGADPGASAWVSASAGTGKTQVLSARVLRLLLEGADPSRILALTFTKAAASEMQDRVFRQLSDWVRAGDNQLKNDLAAIRAGTDPETCARARTLFARTLDARGGLKVQTIHAFAQSLLASFPVEAGVPPGFQALDDRSGLALRRRVLADAVTDAAAEGDTGFAADLAELSIAAGEAKLADIAALLVRHHEAIAALGSAMGFEPAARRWLGLPSEGTGEAVLRLLVATLDDGGIRRVAEACGRGGVSGVRTAEQLLGWLGSDASGRVAGFAALYGALFAASTGEPRKNLIPAAQLKLDPTLAPLLESICGVVSGIESVRALLAVATLAARHLRVGARLGAAYARAKRRMGVIDYDEMIARAAALLGHEAMAAWVRFKLDARIDHLLVDEAQDTAPAQWDIVRGLTSEFFDGEGAREAGRTLFVVGDFKQSIYSFQGADPRVFQKQAGDFGTRAGAGAARWEDVALAESFRSVPAVLAAVDVVLATIGPEALGLDAAPPPHVPARGDLAGEVRLWAPLAAGPDAEDDEEAEDGGDSETPWVPAAHIRMAHNLGKQIAAWLDPAHPMMLEARGRPVRPGDIMVLVRARGEFMAPLVAALHANGVPVAGIDRLRLTQPMAVQDLLALARFALQPDDDLTLAALLVSPLVGLDHDTLFALAHDRRARLWQALRDSSDPAAVAAVAWLDGVLALADFVTPYGLLDAVLTRMDGRRRLLARLGEEARDPIDSLLAAALEFEATQPPSLQGFLAWIGGEDVDLKRDMEAASDAVRIMTVHGAKGLQAPVVVLADAAADMKRDPDGHVMAELVPGGKPVPLFHGGKAGKLGPVGAEAERAAALRAAEHWRLLYVAMTRAEDVLCLGGALTRGKTEAPAASWLAKLGEAFDRHCPDAETIVDPIWGSARVLRRGHPGVEAPKPAKPAPPVAALPSWARAAAPAEARPPRPLSPSSLGEEGPALAPPGPAQRAAAERGKLIHALFERLPAVPPPGRRAAALAWLAAHGGTPEIADTVFAILEDARFAPLFGPDALAEAPVAAVLGPAVIAGTVDRLLVTPGRVQVVDFKTGAKVPRTIEEVPAAYLRQMGAYAAALGVVFPGRQIDAALLYTHDATLLALPPEVLVAYRP